MRHDFRHRHPQIKNISIHAPQWGATGTVLNRRDGCYFNPRTPVGCDNYRRRKHRSYPHFNPRTPVGCDGRQGHMIHACMSDFNPRTPVGCDPEALTQERMLLISIHAPQWGATVANTIFNRIRAISIHAPQWGATTIVTCDVVHVQNFNPRTPVGCDATCRKSTHNSSNFNPRTPVGCDAWRGTDLCVCLHFNPRTPVGCDFIPVCTGICLIISIHAPQWGAT